MREVILQLCDQRLIAVLSLPDGVATAAPALVIPNTGLDHRVGPNRLHVQLCRAFAAAGFPALRLDLSGMGDSAPVPAHAHRDETRDLQAAIDAMQPMGIGRRIVVLGLCSGAHDAHLLARADERVVGAALIDGYAYSTLRYFLNYLGQRVSDPERLWSGIRSRYGNIRHGRPAARFEISRARYNRRLPRAEVAGDLQQLIGRRVALCYVYTGQLQNEYNYADQLTDAFPVLRGYQRLQLHHLVDADHTFSRTSMRVALISHLLSWLRSEFSGSCGVLQPAAV